MRESAGLPDDPFALVTAQTPPAFARRELDLSGGRVELLWLPARKGRPGVPTDDRPAFRESFVDRILAEEALWRSDDLVLTPNRYAFAARQLLLWSSRPLREPDRPMLEATFELTDRSDGTALMNTVGAAASVTRAHVHLLAERKPYLAALPNEPFDAPYLDGQEELEVSRITAPYPSLVVGLRGPVDARARAALRLLDSRTSPAFNLVAERGCVWVFPRSLVEIPAPFFPHALGAAEIWGRWCFADEAPFRAATPQDLRRALSIGGYPI